MPYHENVINFTSVRHSLYSDIILTFIFRTIVSIIYKHPNNFLEHKLNVILSV